MQRASDLIKHLQELIDKYWDHIVVWFWFDSDDWHYDIDEFCFSLKEIVKDEKWNYRYENYFKTEEKEKVFLCDI